MDVRFGATFALFTRHLACPSSSPTLDRAGSLVAVLDSREENGTAPKSH